MLKDSIKTIMDRISELEQNPTADKKLPQNVWFLDDRNVLCLSRESGESRYPLDSDGLVVWAKSTGFIEACESSFFIFKPIYFADDASVNFCAGIPNENGEFFPVSILGADSQLYEPFSVKRYVVYSQRAAYYIADTDDITFAVRLHVDKDKHIHFAQTAINKSGKTVKFYLSSYFDAILSYTESAGFWSRMSKFGERDGENAILRMKEDSLNINRKSVGGKITDEYYTVAKSDFLGRSGCMLTNAYSLRTGRFNKQFTRSNTSEIPIAGGIVHYELGAGEDVRIEYDLSYCHSSETAHKNMGAPIDIAKIDSDLYAEENREYAEISTMTVDFDNWKGSLNSGVVSKFIRKVQKQVSFCALGKNYAGRFLGMRDVFQQLEGSLIWQPQQSRSQIVRCLNYILEDGRAPRQFTLPATPTALPEMDLREYIDQGVWIIDTIHTYLAYTDDWSILDEICSYYVVNDSNTKVIRKSDISDSVLCHMLRIMDFLSRNLDREDGTNCLRALVGDWNDALDALGKTDDPSKKFGTGVSVMATLQFYQCCREMNDILSHIGGYDDKIKEYNGYRAELEVALPKYAIDVNSKGERRIIQGWGDKMSYKVCSWNDPDGIARRSGIVNAFWAICGMVSKDPSLKKEIIETFKALDSKYGLKTTDVPFTPNEKIGRLSRITPGTYENCCAYVHASIFCEMAAFMLGESKFAWEQMEKSMVISHENCSMTSFAQPNSYCENEEWQIDGASMGDWYTGSGAVLVKGLIRFGFGIRPTIDGLRIQVPATMPSEKASISIVVKGHPITLKYADRKNGKRSITVDGKEPVTSFDELMNIPVLFIKSADLHDNMIIEVCD